MTISSAIKDREYQNFRDINNIPTKAVTLNLLPNETIPVDVAGKLPIATIKTVAANTKQSHLFQDGCRQFLIRSEKITQIKYNFNEVSYDSNQKLTITSGGFLKISGVYLSNITIYFDCDKNCDVEILEWHD